MNRRRHNLMLGIVALGALTGTLALMGRSQTGPATPQQVLTTFLHAAATGDGATACAQLSAAAKRQVVAKGACADGISYGASVYGSTMAQLKVSDLKVSGGTATASSTLSGQPTATFTLRKTGGKWLIVGEQRVQAATTAGSKSPAPSEARVEAVASCLDKPFGAVENQGLDSTGGVPHVVLAVSINGYSAAAVDVFSSALAAVSGFQGIKSAEQPLSTRLAGGSVVVYLKSASTAQQKRIEACG